MIKLFTSWKTQSYSANYNIMYYDCIMECKHVCGKDLFM